MTTASYHPTTVTLPDLWATLVGIIQSLIDQGEEVRVHLPGCEVGAALPIEDASVFQDLLVLRGPRGTKYYVASPAEVVVMSRSIVEPGKTWQPPAEIDLDQWDATDASRARQAARDAEGQGGGGAQ